VTAASVIVKKIRLNSTVLVSFKSSAFSIISSALIITVSAVERLFSLSLYNLFMNFFMNSVFLFQLSSHTLSTAVVILSSLSINIIIYNSVRLFKADSENDLISEIV
ncbi:hypothetical protein EMPG_11373, partial [Blastomyces silverae]